MNTKKFVIKKITPLLNYVIVTANTYTEEESVSEDTGLLIPNMTGTMKPYQTVISVSPRITTPLKQGDTVLINIDRYGRTKQKKDSLKASMDEYYNAIITYDLPVITIDGIEYLKLGDNDIEGIIEEFEYKDIERKRQLIVPHRQIIN